MIHELDEKESHELLRKGGVARLGCIAEGEPYIVPVNYIFDGECAFVHSLVGRKITAMRAHPRVCLQVDEIVSHPQWKSVLAFGDYEEVATPAERASILDRLFARFPLQTPVEAEVAQGVSEPQLVVFRIRVNKITGVAER